MTTVSSLPQTIWHWFANHIISPVRHTLLSDLTTTVVHRLQQFGNYCTRLFDRQRVGIWLLAATGASLLFLWNGVFLLALSLGLSTTLLIRRYHATLTTIWQKLPRWLAGFPSPALVSVGGGSLAFVASYLTLLTWQETNSFGLASFLLLEGLGFAAILGVLIRYHLYPEKQDHPAPHLDQWIHNLTALDPLRRLIAVRQITHYVDAASVDMMQIQELQEYLQLLLKQESEPSIQKAISEGLKQMNSYPLQ